LRTCELTYLSVRGATEPGRGLTLACDGIATGAGERFRYVEPAAELLSKAGEVVDRQPQVPDMPRQFAYSSEELRDSPNGNGQA
jgi:hypothetical protein